MIWTTFPKNIVHIVLGVVSLGGLQLERVIGLLVGVGVAWQLVWPVDGLLHVPTCKFMTIYQGKSNPEKTVDLSDPAIRLTNDK